MFSENVYEDMITGREGNMLMPSINIRDWICSPDASFVITLRMLLYPRLTEGSRLTLHTYHTRVNRDFVGDSDELVRNWFYAYTNPRIKKTDALTLITLGGNNQGISRIIDTLNDTFNTYGTDSEEFAPMKDLRAFFAPHLDASFFINEKRRNTVIVAKDPSLKHYHYLQTVCSRLLPWFFDGNPLTETEKNLIESLANENGYSTYRSHIDNFLEAVDMRSVLVRNIVEGFETRVLETRLETIQSDIERAEADMHEYIRAYARVSSRRDDLISHQTGLKVRIEERQNDSELLDYFIHNKGLHPIDTDDRTISFLVTTYLDSFDPDLYETVSRNQRSAFLNRSSDYEELNNTEDRLKLFDAIFGDEPTIKIRTIAYFWLDTRGEVESTRYYDFPYKLTDTHIPNPHLYFHNCLGQNAPAIVEAISAGDLTGAVGQCIAAAANINIGEEPTVIPFLDTFLNTSSKCLEFPDGTLCNPVEALNKLKELEVQTEREENNGETD